MPVNPPDAILKTTETTAKRPPVPTPPRDRQRVKTPTVLQMESVECGAATLGIILGHYGRIVPLEELRLACGVSRDGSRASNMLRAARTYGLQALGYRKENVEDLYTLRLPAIVFWNFKHFVVLEGFGKHWVYINDPASGPKKVSYEEFDQSFTGVVLVFEPGPDFKRGGAQTGVLASLATRLRGSEKALTYIVLLSLFLVLPGLIVPVFSKVFVDNFLIARSQEWIKPLLIGMVLTAILRGVLTWLQQHYLLRLETKLALAASSRFFWHTLRLPVVFFSQRFSGEIASRVLMNDQLAQFLSGQLATTLLSLLTLVFYAVVMFQYNVLLTWLSIFIVALNLLALHFIARKRSDANHRLLQEQGKLTGTTMAGLQMIETLKATGAESDFFARWSGHQAMALNAQQELGVATNFLNAAPAFLSAVNNTVVLGVGGWLVIEGRMTLGTLVAFQTLINSFVEPVNKLVALGNTLQLVDGSLKRLDDVLKNPADAQTEVSQHVAGSAQRIFKLAGYLELRSLTFGYSRMAPPLIQDFSLNLKPGERVALVGSTGCGKSTISKLISGIYPAWEGEILFDGQRRQGYSRGVFANSVAMVDQEIFLFEGTIRENLCLWDSTVPEASIIQAAKDACIHDDIAARNGGYESLVEEGGRNFSGGQRQRLELARALVNNPNLLILDEATSALDARTEKLIDSNLRRRGCTCLVIAHRLSTIRDCDEIIVLDRGKVVQRGTHEELARSGGLYVELIKN